MLLKKIIPIILVIFFVLCGCQTIGDNMIQPLSSIKGYFPEEGFVPDANTAKLVAEAVWLSIYEKPSIMRQKPFIAKLIDNRIWIVEGQLSKEDLGGTAYIEIDKMTGQIITLHHTR